MPSTPIRIPFPLGGLAKNSGYESGDIQTTRGCLNVVPDSSEESRTRGGSRVGLTKRYTSSVGGTPTFAIRVSGGDNTRVYEYLVIGTANDIFVGQSQASTGGYPITYGEALSTLTGDLITEAGDNIIAENGTDKIILFEFNTEGSGGGLVTTYRDKVIINSNDQVISATSFSGDYEDRAGTVEYQSGELRLDDSVAAVTWTNEGLDEAVHYVEITNTSSTPTLVKSGTYKIGSISSGHIVISGASPIGSPTNGDTETTLTYSIKNGVRELDPNAPTIGVLSPVAGYVPMGADYVISYRDRLVWAKNRTWYMSRQGAPGDYDYAADPEDPSRAVAGTNSEAGVPADPIVSMATAGYDYLIMFSEAAVWVMRGDPAYGGQLYRASGVAGCVTRDAWCNGDATEIYFLGKDGLYMMEPNAGPIRQLSQGKLPRSLRGIDRDNYDVSLVYDPEDNGVLIFIVPRVAGANGEHYWFDIETQSFWPIQLTSSGYQPVYAATFGGAPTRSRRAVLACKDGYIREWTGTSDDGTDVPSYVVFGPYPVSSADSIDGILAELNTVTDKDSVPVTVEVYARSTGEKAAQDAIAGISPSYTFTSKAGRSQTKRPRIRGAAFCIRISATGAWAFEAMSGMIAAGGKNRRI